MDIVKIFLSIFKNTYFLITIGGMFVLAIFLFLINDQVKDKYRIFYFSESERLITPIKQIDKLTPNMILTKDNKRFIRNSVAYTLRERGKVLTCWLAKRGTAYTWMPDQTEEGKGKIIGTLWKGILSVVPELENEITQEWRERLKESLVYVTVELEKGTTPKGSEFMSEKGVKTEANQGMADLIGVGIRQRILKEDWVKNFGLMAIGALAYVVAQMMGVI
jgi:hypothetical protein